MAVESISSLFVENPITTLTDDYMFEVAGDAGAGVVSGATKFSALVAAFVAYLQANGITGTPISGSTVSGTLITSTGPGSNLGAYMFCDQIFDRSNGAGFVSLTGSTLLISPRSTNIVAIEVGTSDQRLRIGAASGTGGGVLDLNIISAAPTPVTGHVQICYLTAGINFDRPLLGVGSGLTAVPGSWTIGSGYTANADAGTKSSSIPAAITISGFTAALNLIASGFGDAFAAVAEKVKALEADAVNLIAPNQ